MRGFYNRASGVLMRGPANAAWACCVAFAVLSAAAPVCAQPSEEAPGKAAPSRAAADAFIWSCSPIALRTGLVLGGGTELRRKIGAGGLFLGARLALGRTSEATRQWDLSHLNGLASAAFGAEQRLGVGILRAQLGIGVLGIYQLAQRIQYERMLAAGLPGLKHDGWSFGPWASTELGAAVVFYDAWELFVQLGPGFTAQRVSGKTLSRWVLSSGLGIGRAL
jgi:hypothetical protein